uniref:Uncharacterized protein n=1 Tax=Romanomermis culicivorax TaxID=13658 RepID=A0A915KF22_ROMCU
MGTLTWRLEWHIAKKNRRLVFLILVSQYSSNLTETWQFLYQMFCLLTAGNCIKKNVICSKVMKISIKVYQLIPNLLHFGRKRSPAHHSAKAWLYSSAVVGVAVCTNLEPEITAQFQNAFPFFVEDEGGATAAAADLVVFDARLTCGITSAQSLILRNESAKSPVVADCCQLNPTNWRQSAILIDGNW